MSTVHRTKQPVRSGSDQAHAVWIVADCAFVRRVVPRLLANMDCESAVFEAGASALDAFNEQRHQPPRVVLLDEHAPGLTGLEVACQFRQRGYRGVLCMLAESPDDLDRREMERVGIGLLLDIPVRVNALAVVADLAKGQAVKPTIRRP